MLAVLLHVLSLVALAAPAGFVPVAAGSTCQVFAGPVQADGTFAVRAECLWTDASLNVVAHALTDVEQHPRIWTRISRVKVVEKVGSRVRVVMVQAMGPFSPRQETLIVVSRREGDRFVVEWKLDPEQVPMGEGLEPVVLDEGFWHLSQVEQGLHVIMQIRYDPGGMVRNLMSRKVFGTILLSQMDALHAHVAGR